jgi:hypothetical protein
VRPLSPSTPGEMNVFAAGGKDTAGTPFSQIAIKKVAGISIGSVDYQDEAQCAEMIRILQSESKEAEVEIPDNGERIVNRMKDGKEYAFCIIEPYVFNDEKCWTCSGLFSLLQK